MNLDYYWRLRPWQWLLMFVTPWRGGYRPMGGAFYLPLFQWFGLDPVPYHVALAALLLVNVWLVFRFARALECPEPAAWLAAMAACYHAGLSFLYFNTSFVYDALCSVFYLAGFVYYAGIRSRGERPGPRQMALFLAIYWCALTSKEMAVTLPVVLLVYEWLYAKQADWRTGVWAGALTLPIVFGVLMGPNSLVQNPEYRPELSVQRVTAFQMAALGDLFESWQFFTPGRVAGFWALLTVLAWMRRRRQLRFCWWFLLITPLPIEFLPGRGSACLAIPMCGMAVFAAVLLVDLAGAAARSGRAPVVQKAVFSSVLAMAAALWAVHNARVERRLVRPQMWELGQQTWEVIRQFDALNPQIRRPSTVVFLNDPFEDFDMAFIAELWFGRRDVTIRLHRKTPLGPGELARAEHIFTYEGNQLRQLR
jgi:hypothetical protein